MDDAMHTPATNLPLVGIDPRTALIAALTQIYGVRVPTSTALTMYGLHLTPSAVSRRRRKRRMPFTEQHDGRQYYVDVAHIADRILGAATQAQEPTPHPHRGRPRRIPQPNIDESPGASR